MMEKIAVKKISRASKELLEKFSNYGVSTIHEALGQSGLLNPYLRPIYSNVHVVGSAITVLTHPGDNWMIHVALELCLPGDILVVACSGDSNHGMFGDLLATSAIAHGVVGLIIDAGCRDVKELRSLAFPVWAKAISAKGTLKRKLGSVNIPIRCAGQFINPGDIIVADDDGVVCIPMQRADEILKKSTLRMELEDFKRKQLSSGVSSIDINRMRSQLETSGLKYLESTNDLKNV